ncbi:MAG: uroporphyrinogen-III synthase [Acidimicrobiales bacterium]|nr:uroporphyrinogen-III synthase [Acidimicrobiales bacterium]
MGGSAEPLPLAGLTIAVTRAEDQADALSAPLRSLGAAVVVVPLIAFEAPEDGGAALRDVAARLREYAWVVLTSANGARALLAALGPDAQLGGVRFAAVGPATARVLLDAGAEPPLLPERFVAEGLLEVFPPADLADLAGPRRVALVRAAAARGVLPAGLRDLGYDVDDVAAYRTVAATVTPQARRALAAVDLVTFTSPSTLHRFIDLFGADLLRGPRGMAVAVIGPVTADAAAAAGIAVDVVAARSELGGLVEAICTWVASR